jgi:PEP-CTERM motif
MKRLMLFSILITAAVIGGVAPAAATSIHVQVNTAPLIGNAAGPFFLDFALTDGSGTLAGPNTVVVSHFNFAGGGAVGSATLTGGANGSLASSVTLSDNANFFNELFQQFTPGPMLGFDITTTTNADPISPDAFAFAILDKNLFNLPTTGVGDSLLLLNISPVVTIQTASTTAPAGVIVSATAIPEPATLLLVGTGIVAAIRRRVATR